MDILNINQTCYTLRCLIISFYTAILQNFQLFLQQAVSNAPSIPASKRHIQAQWHVSKLCLYFMLLLSDGFPSLLCFQNSCDIAASFYKVPLNWIPLS
jgi:hypothetical protein